MRSPEVTLEFTVNGTEATLSTDPIRRLSDVLRDDLGLTGTKVGCNAGDCGACTVLLDGRQVCACLVPVGQVGGRSVVTVEGLAADGRLHDLQRAFHDHGAAQCGICTPGMLMAAADLLARDPAPDEAAAMDALGGVLCRCTGYRKIVEAVLAVGGAPAPGLEPAPDPEPGAAVGARLPKTDGLERVDGTALYGADAAPVDALWLRAIRSPHDRARFALGPLDGLHAKYPGLVRVLTWRDVPGVNGFGIYPDIKDQPVLARDRVRYRGEAVLALIGDRDSVEAVRPDELPLAWQPESPVDGVAAALAEGAAAVQEAHPDNVLIRGNLECGDVEHALGQAQAVAEFRAETGFVEHAYIEPEAGWARRVGERIEVFASTQAPYMDRDEVANVLGIGPDRVRIVPAACGGGFGGKLDVAVQPLIAVAAWVLDRPVRAVFTRPESMASSTKRHPAVMVGRFGADRDGRLVAARFHGDFNTGAYASWGPTVAGRVPVHASGPYAVANVRSTSRAVLTNRPPAGAFRGFGVPQAAIVHETCVDMLAEQLGIDPLEFRHRNALRAGDVTPSGQRLEASCGLAACLDALRPGWSRARQAAERFNRASGGPIRRGAGVGCMWYGIGNTSMSNPSRMRVGLSVDGRLTLYSGAVDIGQGSNTIMVQICADALGLPARDFQLVTGDTDRTEDGGKTSASRQTFVSGNAARLAGEDLRAQILRLANAGPEAALALDGAAVVVRDGEREARVDLSGLSGDTPTGDALMGEGTYDPPTTALDARGQGVPYATYGFAAQVAEVEVDVELGTVKVTRIAAAHDVGRAVNPTQVEGQIHGGIAQGLGLALMEEFVPGVSENLHDYLVPTFGDVPEIEVFLIEDPEPLGPFGAKGIGEPALVPTAPAIFNAIHHAVGVRLARAPATPDRVRAALLDRERGDG